MPQTSRHTEIRAAAESRILILDGAMGTMIQSRKLGEEIYRGSRFAGHRKALAGCCDVLCLTAPAIVADIHSEYLDAGADIIVTDSFNATSLSLARYGLDEYADEIAEASARIARHAADRYEVAHPGERRWVAGCMGPTDVSLTAAEMRGDDTVTRAALEEAYMRQAAALLRGGADLLMIETVCDILNARAAVAGARRAGGASGHDVPIMLSATLSEDGRVLTGRTPAELREIEGIWSVGFNCGFGAARLLPHLKALADAPLLTSCHPNAGLPDARGRHPVSPRDMADSLRPAAEQGLLNIVGGCCGTTPAHIRAIADMARDCRPRPIPATFRLWPGNL